MDELWGTEQLGNHVPKRVPCARTKLDNRVKEIIVLLS